jgi:hypothetical protein
MKLFGGSKDAIHLGSPVGLSLRYLAEASPAVAMQVRDFATGNLFLTADTIGGHERLTTSAGRPFAIQREV